jgi:phosphoribosylglycinamide formyltransferase 1
MATLHLGFLASHGGSNLQAILDACQEGKLDAVPRVVISNNSTSGALARARAAGVPGYHVSAQTHPGAEEDREILRLLRHHGVDTVILAGYMKRVGPDTLRAYRGRILNIHPALLPRFGGVGLYGKRVHEAVLQAGEKVSGATVHLIDEQYDTGPILSQARVPVREGDTADSLAARVLEQEHLLYVETLRKISEGAIELPGPL